MFIIWALSISGQDSGKETGARAKRSGSFNDKINRSLVNLVVNDDGFKRLPKDERQYFLKLRQHIDKNIEINHHSS